MKGYSLTDKVAILMSHDLFPSESPYPYIFLLGVSSLHINYLIYSISFISFTIMFLVNSLSYLCLP